LSIHWVHGRNAPTHKPWALVDTPFIEDRLKRMSPMGRLGTVEEVAAMALFLASDEASFCTGGQFPVEGGTVSEHPRMF